jgi:hypothetical protein
MRDVVLVRPLGDGVEVRLLEGHPGSAERGRRDGVAIDHGKEVEHLVREELNVLARELRRKCVAVEEVLPAHRLRRDLVVRRIGGWREKVVVGAHLVGVDIKHAGIAPEQLKLGVGLDLGAREPVAVHVEPIRVLPRLRLASVWILGRDDPDDGVLEDLSRRAVVAGGELVENAQLGVGRALFAAVDVPHEPKHDGRRTRQPFRFSRGSLGIPQFAHRLLDGGESCGRDVLWVTDERVAHLAPLPRGSKGAADDAIAGRVDGIDVCIRLGRGHLARAERKAQDLLRRWHGAAEDRRRLHGITRRSRRRGSGRDRRNRKCTDRGSCNGNATETLAHETSPGGVPMDLSRGCLGGECDLRLGGRCCRPW